MELNKINRMICKYKITLTILSICILSSCKRDHVCSCKDYSIITGRTTEISREIIRDTKQNAKKKCSDKWCGDECGCSLE